MNFSPEASWLPLNIVAMCAKPFEVNTLQWGLIDGQYTMNLGSKKRGREYGSMAHSLKTLIGNKLTMHQ